MTATSWAVIGAGRFATDRMVPAILSAPGSRISSIWARNHGAARALAGTVGAYAYPSFDALIGSRPDIAYVAATADTNPGLVAPLLEAGIPVLCEKPVAPTANEARSLAALSEQTGVPCYVNHHLRVNYCVTLAKAAIEPEADSRTTRGVEELPGEPPAAKL